MQTSGSTGKPKGVVHTTGGYLLGAALTVKYVFDVHPDDRFACMADVGWITGHTYIVYGPLANGVSTTVFESTPVYPTPSRYWQTVEKHKLTQFYSAPTAIRLLRRHGEQHVENHDLSSLRVLGSVGEPINPEAWNWYNEHVGKMQCAIVDTFWYVSFGPFNRILIILQANRDWLNRRYPVPWCYRDQTWLGNRALLRYRDGNSRSCNWQGQRLHPDQSIFFLLIRWSPTQELHGNGVEGVLVIKHPWPSIARTINQDHKRYQETYMQVRRFL
jgi:acetyl-CoA synthetase